MAIERHDFRGRSPQKFGKPGVTYPYGDTRFPRIVEMRNARKGTREALLIPFLTPHRDQDSYPGAVLVEQISDAGDDTDKNITETYEVLPGPIFVDVRAYRETGIPMLTSRQRIAVTANYTTGEFAPVAINIASITDNGNGTCTVTTVSPHDLPPKCWVIFGGTNSTPQILGNQQIISVPSTTQMVIGMSVSSPGTAAGSLRAVNLITRELQPVPNNASVMVKIDTMVAVPGFTDMAAKTISSITPTGSNANVNFLVNHGMNVGDWVMLSGTNSIPVANGPHKVIAVPSSIQFTIEFTITGNGTAGTMTPMGPLARFNEDFHCRKDFDFPDFLTAVDFYSNSATVNTTTVYNYSLSTGGAVALPMQDGYRGPCSARRLRCFFVGSPPNSFESNLQHTFIMPSSGTAIVESGVTTQIYKPVGTSLSPVISESPHYRTFRIPHCLTGPNPTVTNITSGSNIATCFLQLPESVPPKFTVGDIITLMGQPSKYDAGGLWEVVVFLIFAPYTSGSPPP